MRVSTAFLQLGVEASAVRLHWKDSLDFSRRPPSSQELQAAEHRLSEGAQGLPAESLEAVMRHSSGSDAFIAAIAHVKVVGGGSDPREGSSNRPASDSR